LISTIVDVCKPDFDRIKDKRAGFNENQLFRIFYLLRHIRIPHKQEETEKWKTTHLISYIQWGKKKEQYALCNNISKDSGTDVVGLVLRLRNDATNNIQMAKVQFIPLDHH
jgi:hypothetical protein